MELLASGRAADVFDLGDGTVLRRYRIDHDTVAEARVMQWLAEVGYPVPTVHHVDGRDLVMEKLEGVTMLDDLGRRPWMLLSHARTLARLQRRLNAIDAPDWLDPRPGVPDGGAIVHLDLHPMNVMMTSNGPIVIDWTNSTRSQPEFDAAMSYVLVTTADPLASRVDRFGRRLFIEAFRSARGRRAVERQVMAAAAYRLTDPNVTAAERHRLEQMLRSRR
jgi:aminoglycoside phosphotransferase (APT) family kinase protein